MGAGRSTVSTTSFTAWATCACPGTPLRGAANEPSRAACLPRAAPTSVATSTVSSSFSGVRVFSVDAIEPVSLAGSQVKPGRPKTARLLRSPPSRPPRSLRGEAKSRPASCSNVGKVPGRMKGGLVVCPPRRGGRAPGLISPPAKTPGGSGRPAAFRCFPDRSGPYPPPLTKPSMIVDGAPKKRAR